MAKGLLACFDLLAERAKGFGMRLAAYDPFVSDDRAKRMGVDLLSLDQVIAESDFLAIHLPKTPDTIGLIDRDLLIKAKPTLRLVNVARGGIVNEQDLADARRNGRPVAFFAAQVAGLVQTRLNDRQVV